MKLTNFLTIFSKILSKLNYLTVIFIILYTILACLVSVNRYWQYQNFYFDLGIFDSAIWKVSRFEIPTIDHVDLGKDNRIIFADHFNPSIFLLSPLYWITNRTEIILIAQSVIVGLAAYVAFLVAKIHLKSKLAILALVVAFLGYVGLQNALITDFHEATVSVLPLMLIFWAISKKNWTIYFISLLILLGLKESFAGLGVTLGVYLFFKNRKLYLISILTILISLVWGVVVIKYIIPFFSQGIYLYKPPPFPTSFHEFILRFIDPALKWKSILYTYLTFGFLPLFDLSILPAIFENYFERFILTVDKGKDLGMHYNAPLSPLMFIGALNVLILMEKHRSLRKIVSIYSIFIILTVLFLHRFHLHGPLQLGFNPVFYEQNQRVKYVDDFISQVPRNGLIMTQNDLAVRFTHNSVKLLRKNYLTINPDVVALNLTPGQNPNSFFPLSFEETKTLKDELNQDKNYHLKKFADELYLFTKNDI